MFNKYTAKHLQFIHDSLSDEIKISDDYDSLSDGSGTLSARGNSY